MDTSDPEISFDNHGICNHCYNYDMSIKGNTLSGEPAIARVNEIVKKLKSAGTKKQYDCVIGLSGGVDSTYTAYVVKNLGLRAIAVHVDNGWNSELAVKNIENICQKLEIDLHTVVLDWEEFRDIQLSFLKASTPDSEIPSDHAIMAAMLQTADTIGVKHVVTGLNTRTESHLPPSWSQGHYDWYYIHKLQKLFGSVPIKTFPHLSYTDFYLMKWRGRFINILNYLDYSKKAVMPLLENELGWKYYGGKHYESIYTRWYQGYWLPLKFGFDKRRCHLSSLICSGETSREDALSEINKPSYDKNMQQSDTSYIIKKLGISHQEFENILKMPAKNYKDYSKLNYYYMRNAYKLGRYINRLKI